MPSSPANLVFAGGTLSYVGSAVTINRGYTVQAASTLDVQSNLTLSGSVTATAGPFDKTGPATLTYTGVGNNTLANGGFPAYRVDAGQVVLAGANAQTNIVGGEFWITGGNLLLSNTVLQSSWVNVGRNATAGSITTLSLTNATINQITGGGFSAGYFEQPPGILATQVVTFGGSSSLTAPGDGVIGWKANSSATLNLNNNSKIALAGDLYFAAEANSIATVNIKDTASITVGGGVGGFWSRCFRCRLSQQC